MIHKSHRVFVNDIERCNSEITGDTGKDLVPCGEGVTLPFRIGRRCGGAVVLHCLHLQHCAIMVNKGNGVAVDGVGNGYSDIIGRHDP